MWPGLVHPISICLPGWKAARKSRSILTLLQFRPVMLAHAIEDTDFANLDASDYIAEWKMGWHPACRLVAGRDARGHSVVRLYSRSGEDITKSFPDLLPSLHLQDSSNLEHDDSRKPLHTFRHHAPFAIDGELLVVRDGRVQTFNVLQQRLNRKVVSPN